MKKLIMFIVIFSYFNSYAQSPVLTSDSIDITKEAKLAKEIHENLYEIVIRAEDMISMLESDIDSGYISKYHAIFYQELLKESIKLSEAIVFEDQEKEK